MYTASNKNQLMSRCIYLHSQFDGNKVTLAGAKIFIQHFKTAVDFPIVSLA